MKQGLLVGTRKDLFVLEQNESSWSIAAHHFAGEPVTQTLYDPRTGYWWAALRLGHFGVKLHCSKDQGSNWQEMPCPAMPAKPTSSIWADDPTPWNVEMIWALASGGEQRPNRLWASTMPAAVFRSDDAGANWQLCESLWLNEKRKAWMGGGNDYPGAHTLIVNPQNPDHVIVAISCGGLWQSKNAGQTWESFGQGFQAEFVPNELVNDPNIQDPHRISACAAVPDGTYSAFP